MFLYFPRFLILVLSFPVVLLFFTQDWRMDRGKVDDQRTRSGINMQSVPIGMWGGDHIRLAVTAEGAEVEYDCAHGSIDQKIIPDASGHFTVRGTHVREHGGPTRRDEIPDSHPAEFTGQIKDQTMTLTVRESDTKESVGTFTLGFNQKPQLMKCR